MSRLWYLVKYPNGVEQIERFDRGEASVKSRAVGKPVERVEIIQLTDEQLRLIANWKSGAVVNRDASDEECREFISGAMNDLLSLVADLWPIQSSSEGEK